LVDSIQGSRRINKIQSPWARHTGQELSANAFRQLTGKVIETALPDPIVRLSVVTQTSVIQNGDWCGIIPHRIETSR